MRTRLLRVELLEDRWLPAQATAYAVTNLVSDQANVAKVQDPNLVNGWGIAVNPAGAFWVSSNGGDKATLYTGDVKGSPVAVNPLVVSIPDGAPTGQVFNGTSDFVVRSGTASGPAAFIFASESGDITGWSPAVPPPAPSTQAQVGVTVPNAVFKGLAMGNNGTGNFLYAADFHGGTVDVFDKNFQKTTLAGNFTDPNLPAGFAPFNVALINGKLYVSYAVQDAAKHDDVRGPGNGFVDVFDLNGNFQKRLISNGALNSPWGMLIAPATFGEFGGDLLVGNFGDGKINVYDPNTGAQLGTLTDAAGQPVVIDGLWGLAVGNGSAAGDANAVYFSAGPGGESHGLFGSIRANTPVFAAGAGVGGGAVVNLYSGLGGTLLRSITAYPGFNGSVAVATGDLNGDGFPDVVTGAGPTGGPDVRVFDGKTGALFPGVLGSFFAYDAQFPFGVSVAVGDVNGDGTPDIITGIGPGGGPNVKVFSGKDGAVLGSFFAYDPQFAVGISVAAGDFNGDGKADIVTGPGAGGGPNVKVFSGADFSTLKSFFAYDPQFAFGVSVAAADVNGDGTPDIMTGVGAGGGPNVKVFSGKDFSTLSSFFAFDPQFAVGARVAAVDFNAAGQPDIVVAPGAGGGPNVKIFNGANVAATLDSFFAFDPAFAGGVFVG